MMHGRTCSGRPQPGAPASTGRRLGVRPALVSLALLGILVAAAVPATALGVQTTTRASVSTAGVQGNGHSRIFSSSAHGPGLSSLSADGRYLAFYSEASNLVAGDTNGTFDVFVRDLLGGGTTRVSAATGGAQGDSASTFGSLSADGRHVAFQSYASNLVPGDTNGWRDVFLRDLDSGETTRVSVASDGTQGNSRSVSGFPSADGRYVAFQSDASNLVPGDTNAATDVFIRDLVSGETTRVSVGAGGTQATGNSELGSMSSDGRFVAFQSFASDLVPGDTNGRGDIFLRDMVAGTTTRVSVATSGAQGNNSSLGGSVSADGRRVAFYSYASNFAPIDANGTSNSFVRDLSSGETTCVGLPAGGRPARPASWGGSLSADGGRVAFLSSISGIIVRDLATGKTTAVGVSSAGVLANMPAYGVALSGDGSHVVFDSAASNLAPGDTNGLTDVFVGNLAPIAPALGKTPSGSSFTLIRRKGVARWTFGAFLKTPAGQQLAGRPLVLQKSANGVTWTTAATRTTNASGAVSMTLAYMGAGTSYWRWYFPGDHTYAASSTSKTRTIIR